MSFRRLLLAGTGVLLLVLVATGVVSAYALHSASSRYEQLGRELADDLLAVQQLRAQAEEMVAVRRSVLSHPETPADREHERSLAHARAAISELLLELHARNLDSKSERELQAIDRAATTYVAAATDATARVEELLRAFDDLERVVTEFIDHQASLFDRDLEQARATAAQHELALIIGTTLALIVSLALATVVSRKLGQQYVQSERATQDARREAAARQELLAMVSHDLRTPLTAVVMGSTVLAETLPPDTGPRGPQRHVRAIRNAADRMTSLIGEMLDVARFETGATTLHVTRWEAQPLLARTLELFAERAEQAQITLREEMPTAALEARGDRERVQQVLENLVSNAMKFTPTGGTIVARAIGGPAGVTFEVSDSGPGVAAADQARLFDRYYQGKADARRGSLGLGLHICKSLVEAHGGKIWVESVPGAGATFRFTLPV